MSINKNISPQVKPKISQSAFLDQIFKNRDGKLMCGITEANVIKQLELALCRVLMSGTPKSQLDETNKRILETKARELLDKMVKNKAVEYFTITKIVDGEERQVQGTAQPCLNRLLWDRKKTPMTEERMLEIETNKLIGMESFKNGVKWIPPPVPPREKIGLTKEEGDLIKAKIYGKNLPYRMIKTKDGLRKLHIF